MEYSTTTEDADVPSILKSNYAGAVIGFKGLKREDVVNGKAASSFINFDQAEINLHSEVRIKNLEAVKKAGRAVWNDILVMKTMARPPHGMFFLHWVFIR